MESGAKDISTKPIVHPVAVGGFNKKTASLYDAKRPEYSSEAADAVLKYMNLDNLEALENLSADILELGAGTGKFTKSILPKIKKPVKYLATDPMEGFLEQAKMNCPNIATRVCLAEDLPFPDSSIRLVVAAQCFHWFASDTSLKEIHRVLVPGGKFICLWNNRDISIPWIKAASDLLHEYYNDETPRAVNGKWKKVMEKATIFKELSHCTPTGPKLKGDKHRIADYFITISAIASRPEEEINQAKQKFMEIFYKFHPNKPDTEEWVLPFLTEVYCYVKV